MNWSVIVSAVSSARSVNVAMPPRPSPSWFPAAGQEPAGERGGYLGRVVAGLHVAILVFDIDHRLGAEGRTGCRCRARLCLNRQLGRRRRADTMLLEVAAVRTGELVNWSVMVSAVSSARSVNVAMPPEAVTVVVPCSGPVPTGSDRPSPGWCCRRSPDCRTGLRRRSTGCVPNATPAVAVGEGCVLIANWLAAAGLTTMLLDFAAVSTGELVK